MARFCVDVKQLIVWFSLWLEKSILQVECGSQLILSCFELLFSVRLP